MRIAINNIAGLKSATIDLPGITLIAGPNQSGKSTVGRIVYSIIKSIVESDNIFASWWKKQVSLVFSQLQFALIENEKSYKSGSSVASLLLSDNPLGKDDKERLFILFERNDFEKLAETIKILCEKIEKVEEKSEKDWIRVGRFLELLKEIGNIANSPKRLKVDLSLNIVMSDMFHNQIIPLWNPCSGSVDVEFSPNNIGFSFATEVQNGNINLTRFEELQDPFGFQDVTYVETPFLLQLVQRSGSRSMNYSDEQSYISHWKDLMRKVLRDPASEIDNDEFTKEICHVIEEVIGGKIIFDSTLQRLLLVKKDSEQRLDFQNFASGVKTFALLHGLARNGYLNGGHLIILDEPENHLHPVWQVRLAGLLIDCMELSGVKFLINSHSPYFVEAIKSISKKKDILWKKTALYYTQFDEKSMTATIQSADVGEDNDDPIFSALYSAYDEIDKKV